VSDALPPTAWPPLAACITRWTGFHPDAIWGRAVRAAVQPLLDAGLSAAEVVGRAQRDDPELRRRLTQAVPVGESYFFRVPEHFAFVRRTVVSRWAAEPDRLRSIWSAGCAGGEEAYSLAAVLRACGVRAFEVVGTDLVQANVDAAVAGRFGPWSLRGAGAPPAEVFVPPAAGDVREVAPALRARTRFLVHNLLDAPPAPGCFDLVFCRNVLIYFTPDAARRVVASLASTLAPGGVLAFAPMDVAETPAGLARVGPPELQLFERRPAEAPADPPAPRPRAAAPPQPVSAPPPRRRPAGARAARPAARPSLPAPDPVSLHVRALAHLDRGDHAGARALLVELVRVAPAYLPGALEGALLHAREGRRATAVELMRSVLERALSLPAEEPVPGPETLPARFYAAAAQSFLGSEVRR
jgi:chemotaxis protein methyltransferase CheR